MVRISIPKPMDDEFSKVRV